MHSQSAAAHVALTALQFRNNSIRPVMEPV